MARLVLIPGAIQSFVWASAWLLREGRLFHNRTSCLELRVQLATSALTIGLQSKAKTKAWVKWL